MSRSKFQEKYISTMIGYTLEEKKAIDYYELQERVLIKRGLLRNYGETYEIKDTRFKDS